MLEPPHVRPVGGDLVGAGGVAGRGQGDGDGLWSRAVRVQPEADFPAADVRAVCAGETGIAGLICRYGYYGDLALCGGMPPMLVVHGEKDMTISPSGARAFVERARAVSGRPVSYAELPGAYHDFDMFESIRSAAVSTAVEQFTARVSTAPP